MKTCGRRALVLPRSSTSGLENQITSCIKYVPRKTYRLPLAPHSFVSKWRACFIHVRHLWWCWNVEREREKKKITIADVHFDTDFNFSSREKRKRKQISLIDYVKGRNFIGWKRNRNLKCQVQKDGKSNFLIYSI